ARTRSHHVASSARPARPAHAGYASRGSRGKENAAVRIGDDRWTTALGMVSPVAGTWQVTKVRNGATNMRRIIRRVRGIRSERGAALVEFALVVPLLMLMMCATID